MRTADSCRAFAVGFFLGVSAAGCATSESVSRDRAELSSRVSVSLRDDLVGVWRNRQSASPSHWSNPVVFVCGAQTTLRARGLPIDRATTAVIGDPPPVGVVSGGIEVRSNDDLRRALLALPSSAWPWGLAAAIEVCSRSADDPVTMAAVNNAVKVLRQLGVYSVQ